ncbi:HVA1 family protein [Micromonospora sp. LOL_024]|uniref:HVA1 family protein n=1 Tax=Micromonospora sp. LOL_024 TaxID=3345412 RepID=UPI003A8C6214
MAEKEYHRGDHVSWASHSGRAHGVVREKLTERSHLRRTPSTGHRRLRGTVRHDGSSPVVAHRPEVLRHEPH